MNDKPDLIAEINLEWLDKIEQEAKYLFGTDNVHRVDAGCMRRLIALARQGIAAQQRVEVLEQAFRDLAEGKKRIATFDEVAEMVILQQEKAAVLKQLEVTEIRAKYLAEHIATLEEAAHELGALVHREYVNSPGSYPIFAEAILKLGRAMSGEGPT
ncbi:MAG: hypothetical protein Q7O66_13840 [Dehalococcoidia bacterium]|nr:hypothetical protein [Dehalococcoidia bacterium]